MDAKGIARGNEILKEIKECKEKLAWMKTENCHITFGATVHSRGATAIELSPAFKQTAMNVAITTYQTRIDRLNRELEAL